MLQLDVWVFVLSLIGVLIVGGVAGFFLARYLIKKNLEFFSEKSHFPLYIDSGGGFELAFSAEYRRHRW